MGLINKSQVKAFLRRNNVRIGIDFYQALDKQFEQILITAIQRTRKNQRTTISEIDL
ncbi:MAG: hypothetical protein ACP5N9_04390 [Candidatus Bilamarchaeum sp.]